MIAREGFEVNNKKVRCIYREEKLQVRHRGGRKRALGTRKPMLLPDGPNQRWSLDFVSDALTDGRRFRILAVVDDFSRENLVLIADTPRAERGLLCEGARFPSPRLHAALTSARDVDAAEPFCSASRGQHPNLMKAEAASNRWSSRSSPHHAETRLCISLPFILSFIANIARKRPELNRDKTNESDIKYSCVDGIALSIPSTASPEQALIIGDTGCRRGGAGGEDCNNGRFSQRIADAVAKLKPNLIVHAGDFTYRDNNSRRLHGMPWQR